MKIDEIQKQFNKLIKSDSIIEQSEIIDSFLQETIKLTYIGTFKRDVEKYVLELEKCCIYLKLLYKAQEELSCKETSERILFKKGKIVFLEAFSQKGSGLKEPRFLYGFFFALSELLIKKYNLDV